MALRESLQHLNTLSILYYVFAGLAALGGCVPFIHLTFGLMMILQPGTFAGGKGPPPPAFLGWLFVGIAATLIITFWTLATCAFLTGRYLKQRTHHLFCLIIAGIACTNVPLGAVLGVFTFIVLLRPEVKHLFASGNGNAEELVSSTAIYPDPY